MMTTRSTIHCIILCYLGLTVVRCTITLPPSNIAVMSEDTTTLECASDSLNSASIYWFTSPGAIYIVTSCAVVPGYETQYSVENSIPGRCDLRILNASSAHATLYSCQEGPLSPSSSAYLTVLSSPPSCYSNTTTKRIPEHTVVSSSCNVNYTSSPGGPTAIMTWSAGCTVSSVIDTTTFYSSSATVIALRPTLRSCDCTTHFSAPLLQHGVAENAPVYPVYVWSSPSDIAVSYCPTLTITPSGGTVSQYSLLTCNVVAYPNVSQYTWTAETGTGVELGHTFNLTSLGDYSVSCTATNYLTEGTSDPCRNTTTVTGRTVTSCPPACSNAAAIVLGILFAISFLVNIAFVIFIIRQSRTTDTPKVPDTSPEHRPPDPLNYEALDTSTQEVSQNEPGDYEVLPLEKQQQQQHYSNVKNTEA